MADKKGIVIKTEGNKVYILTDDGEFATVNASGALPAPGDEYAGEHFTSKPVPFGRFRLIASAAALLIVFLVGGGAFAYNIPVSTKTLSMDPAVELKTNVFRQVISVSSTDTEVERQLEELDLKNPELEDKVQTIIENAQTKANEHRVDPDDVKGTGRYVKDAGNNDKGANASEQGKENSEDRNGNE
ncbi:MAG: anti-sigma factor domain-containing protein [Clostridiaceae bacterium]